MIRNVIFDWSGTLVDDLPAVWKATNQVFRRAGLGGITLDRFRAEFCLPFKKFYDRYSPDIPMAQLEAWFHEHFREVQDEVEELPHARAFLALCRARGVRTFLLSTIHRDHFAAQSVRTGFGTLIDRPYVEVPDKRLRILSVLTENELRADETLFIGDMQHDIETAKHGRVHSCAVLTGYTGRELLRASEPDLIVEHLGELREALEACGWHPPLRASARPASDGGWPVVTVGALIFNAAGEVLMIQTHKWSNLWGIPGGKIKFGEPAVEALRRELLEETNLEVEEIEFVLVQDCIHSREFYRDAHFVLLNYTCGAGSGREVRLNHEAQHFRWVPLEEAFNLRLNEPTRVLLDAVRSRRAAR